MAEYVTNVLEMTEAGIPVRVEGEHVIRVLGAQRQRILPDRFPGKEQLAAAGADAYARYYAGELAPPPPDPTAPDEPFDVPQAFVDAEGDITFLKRGGSA